MSLKIINYICYGLLLLSLIFNIVLVNCNSKLKLQIKELKVIEEPIENSYLLEEIEDYKTILSDFRASYDSLELDLDYYKKRKNYYKRKAYEFNKEFDIPYYISNDSLVNILTRYGRKSPGF